MNYLSNYGYDIFCLNLIDRWNLVLDGNILMKHNIILQIPQVQ